MHITVKSNTTFLVPDEHQNDVSKELLAYGYKLESGIWEIPNGIVGVISTKNFRLEITPSIEYLSFYDYFNLLKLNFNSKLNDNLRFTPENITNDLADSILCSFREELIKLTIEGIPRKYKVHEERASFFKGNTDVVQTMINIELSSNPPIVNRIENLSFDYPEMIAINKAYKKYNKITGKKIHEFERISKYISKSVASDEYLDHISFKKLEYCYDLSYMILKNINGISTGEKNNLSLLINSNSIFETFVIKAIKSIFTDQPFKEKESLKVAQTENLSSSVYIEPDMMYMGPLKVVLDMKNKNYFKGINSSDFHQMISYMRAFDANTALLIYPVISDHYDHEILNVINSEDKKIIRYPLNIRKISTEEIRNKLIRYITFE